MTFAKSIIHRFERFSKKAIFGSIEAYRIYYRKKDWRNFALKHTTNSVLTEEQKKKVEDIVNQKISEELDVTCEEMSPEKAKEEGAIGLFDNKYGNIVKVYSIGNYSKEICGGPHVHNTRELGVFKIKKEEAVGAGIRRIKATLSN